MAKPKEPINPFYVLSGVIGVAFTVTACAYGLLMLYANRGQSLADPERAMHPLMSLLDRYGLMILGIEVALISVVSVAAIVLDHFRGKKQSREGTRNAESEIKT